MALGILTGCMHSGIRPVAGTLDGPLAADTAPARVMEAIGKAERVHEHDIMSDTTSNVCVMSLDEADQQPTEGYGIVIVNGSVSTSLPHLRNVRQPQARYDSASGQLWLTSSAMEGTGIQVERLYQIRFHSDGQAFVSNTVEPYDMQQALCQRLGFSIDGQQVTLYDGQRPLCTVTSSITDMGGFDDEQPVWIGEQLRYDLSGDTPTLLVTPGVKFNTGLVLLYDDMPTLRATLSISDEGMTEVTDITLQDNE